MKKITLWLFALFTCWQINAQVGIIQSFPNTTTPAGWDLGSGGLSTTQACASASWRGNVYNATARILTTEAQTSNGQDLTISFDYKIVNWSAATVATNPYNGTVTTQISLDGGTTWTVTAGVINNANHVPGNTCVNVNYVVPGASVPAASNVKVRWNCVFGTSGDYYVYIDNISATQPTATPPLCTVLSSPTNGALNVSNTTITWNGASGIPTGYKLNVGTTAGGTDVLNGFDVGNVVSYNLGALDLDTTYYVTVIPYNANGDATGCTESSFTTCGDIGDFSENFDALGATNLIPACWSRVLSNGVSTFATVGTSTTNNSAPYSIALYNSDSPATSNIMLVTPYINNIDAGTNRLKFFARNSTASEDIQVGTMSNPADASTFTVLQTVDLSTTFQEYSVSFAGYSGTDQYIALRRLSTSTYTYVYIDNVVWEAIPAVAPSCVAITSPTDGAVNVMNSSVTWASNADATGYYINVGYATGTTDVLNLQDVGNVTSYSFPTDPDTTYFVTIVPYNAFGSATGPCTEISFTTCGYLAVPSLETFDTFLPSCWQAADNGNLVSGPATFGTSNWIADGFGNVGGAGAIRYNIFVASANDWVISPVVNIPATGYELKFDAAATDYAGTTLTDAWEADDFVEVLVSTTGTDNWTPIYTFNNTNVPSATGTSVVLDLDAYSGLDVRFAFRAVEGTADGASDIDFFVDNFEIRLTPALAPSCATNVVATPNATCGNFANNITWDATSGADGYFITVGTTTGGTDVANNVDLGNVLSYNFTGTIGTTYYYTILPYNGVGPATGCSEMSFTTNSNGCYCTSAPTSNDANGITNVQIVATNFPTGDVTYFDHSATSVDMSQGISNNVQISFATGYAYNTYILIDFNDDFDFNDAGELVYSGESLAPNPTTLNASFIMPGTAPLGQHRMRIVTADFMPTVDPCYSGTYGVTLDFTVNIVAASCTPPAATTTVVPACGTAQFSVDVNVTALGSGTPSISDGTTTWPVTAIGVVNVGPFADASSVTLTLLHGSDATCNLPLGSFTYSCPPANDDCANAIAISAMPYTNSQNASAATGPVVSTCAGMNDGVWYTVVGNGADIIVELSGVTGWDPEIGVYTGSCGTFTCVGSVDDGGTGGGETYTITASTAGTTYFINLGHYNGFSDSPEGPLTLNVTTTLSSGSFDNANFVAYPNPVKDIFNVSYSSEISSVRVMNLLGQEVITREVNATSTQIDMSQLSSGAYIVNVTVGDTIKTIKVVKQ